MSDTAPDTASISGTDSAPLASLQANASPDGNERLPTEADTPPTEQPSLRDRLSTRIVASSIIALLTMMGMIGWTLWLSWQLEGAAAAINDTGSLRMRANRIGIELLQAAQGHHALPSTRDEIIAQQDTLARLARGVPSRPLIVPDDPAIHEQLQRVDDDWRAGLQPLAERALEGQGHEAYLLQLPGFVAEADQLVRMIEADNAGKTTLLRLSQGVLIVVASVGTMAMIYLLFLWIIAPVFKLQAGLQRMAARDFSVRLPVESTDEFGVLTKGFNRMADELQGLYQDLEERVQSKTALLASHNRDLTALYDMAAFLNQPNEIDELCRGFLQRVMREFNADGGSIRVLAPSGDKLHLVVSEGLSHDIEEDEHCMRVNDCFCGQAVNQGVIVIKDFRKLPKGEEFQCAKEGFQGLSVFRIVTQEGVLGSFSLHFRHGKQVPQHEAQLLETLGQHLGVALDNRRLSNKARQLAVAEERNLMAQGLHDSLAQALNFLNLQVQMLEGAVGRQDWRDIEDIMPLLKAGVDESYQDVRELLLNFRDKLTQGEMRQAVEDTVARFRRQTGLPAHLQYDDAGAPLAPEQQLQVLFILQEALSNVRKHAQASEVRIRIENQRDFVMNIEDDGQGFDQAEVEQRGEAHIGLNIMRERAMRLHAQLDIHSTPGQGTRLALQLHHGERQAA